MSDLVKRLRETTHMYQVDCELKMKCADRIEELEADNKGLRHMILDQINSTGDDPEIMAATKAEWAARAKDAEAKVARAIETLQVFADDANWFDSFELDAVTINPTWRGPTFTPEQFARDVINELKGDSDEQTTDSHDY